MARRLYTVLMFRLAHRLSSHTVLLGVVNSDQDMAVDKFYESPMTYVLFISVTFMELVSVLCQIQRDETQLLPFIPG